MKKLSILTFAVLIIISASLHAETKYERVYGECVDEAGMMNNSVMLSCSEKVSLLAKKDITTFYKQIEIKVKDYDDSGELMKMLESGQKAWIQYRNNHCALSNRIAFHAPYCLMLINSQRAEELKSLAE